MRIFLTLVALLLAALITAELLLWQPHPPAPVSDGSASIEAAAPLANADPIPKPRLPGLRVYREIMERPLFSKDRRRPNATRSRRKPQSKPAEFPEHLELQAVLISSDSRTALLFDKQKKETLRLRQNAQVLGWRVVEIQPWGLVLARGTQQISMQLH